jgi:hypothetical protein
MLAILDLRERLIVKLAGICGMRPGEIVGLPREYRQTLIDLRKELAK